MSWRGSKTKLPTQPKEVNNPLATQPPTSDRILPRPALTLLASIFIISLSVLVFEIALTRIFSVLLRFHFVFLTVSLAICGLGIGGLVDFLIRRRWPHTIDSGSFLAGCALLFSLLTPAGIVLLLATPLAAYLTSVWVITAACLPAFVAAGIFLSHAFARYSSFSGHLYSADLLGAALGSCLVLQLVGGFNTPFICGVGGALAALMVAASERKVPMTIAGLLIAILMTGALIANQRTRFVDLPRVPLAAGVATKPLHRELTDPTINSKIIYTEWNAFARTDVVAKHFEPSDDLYIYTDGDVPTNMLAFDGDLEAIRKKYKDFIGFLPFRHLRPDKVLSIGPGGGMDILMALAVGSEQIDGAELNPAIPRIVRKFQDFCGPIYDYQNVDIKVAEGRSYVSRSPERYDLIYMALTKTATTASSSLALSESYAHTVEAFVQYYQHLSDRGQLAFVCQHPLILLRALLTARQAIMQETGASGAEAMKHLAVVGRPRREYILSPYRHMLIMSRRPFTAQQAEKMGKQAVAMDLLPGYFPEVFTPLPFTWLTEQNLTAEQFVHKYNQWYRRPPTQRWDFLPCTDNRPFFVDLTFGIPAQFRHFLWALAAAMLLLSTAAWLWLRQQDSSPLRQVRFWPAVAYFVLLGVGFMLLEITLVQKLVLLLGYPVLTLSVILFSLLLGGGLGSLASQSWPDETVRRRTALAALGIVMITGALYLALPPIIAGTLHLDITLRSALAMALLLPTGFTLGIPFPSGLRMVGAASRDLVPWMWGVNGLASVIGSVGAMVAAKLIGFGVVMLLGAACYGVVTAMLAAGLLSKVPTKVS